MDNHKKELVGGAIGAVAGTIVGGPVGGMVGAAIGAAAGGLIDEKKPVSQAVSTQPAQTIMMMAPDMPMQDPGPAPQDNQPVYAAPVTSAPVTGPPAGVINPVAAANQDAGTKAAIAAINPNPVIDPNSGTPVTTPKVVSNDQKKTLTFALPKAPTVPTAAQNQAAGTAAAIASINPGPQPSASYQSPLTKALPTVFAPKVPTAPVKRTMIPHGEFGVEGAKSFRIHKARVLSNQARANLSYEMGADFGKIELPFNTTIVTEADAYDYLDSTQKQFDAVANDIANSNLPADFLASWAFFKADWDKFYKQGKEETHTFDSQTWMDNTDPYVAKLKTFQTQMQKLGAAKNVPGVQTDPDSTFNPDGTPKVMDEWKKYAIGIGAGAAGLLVLKVLL